MEDIHYQFQAYLFAFPDTTTPETFQQEVTYYNLTIQKTYSIVYQFINNQLQEILQLMTSDKEFNTEHLMSLASVLLFINKNYLRKLETIVLSKCENVFDICLEILELIVKSHGSGKDTDYSKPELVHLLITTIEEAMKPYPNDLYLHTNNQRYLNILVISLSSYEEVRAFIMFLIQSNSKNRDIYNYIIKNITGFFDGIKDIVLSRSFNAITQETVSIALQFRSNFKDISIEFQSFVNYVLNNTKGKRTEEELKTLFSSLFNIIQQQEDKNAFVCYAIGNMLLQVYEDNIDTPEVCQPIISSFFTNVSGEYYTRLLQNTDLIKCFISKLYNQRNQETIAFFFYYLNSLSFSFETARNEVYIPKIEFKTIIESIQYFTHNELILKFIFERLMSLFDQKTTLGAYFLEECDYFMQMVTILAMNNNISMLTLEFTEELLKKNCTERIWDKATKANVFNYEVIDKLDPLIEKKIWINLTYEQRPEKYYDKAHKITGYIYLSPIITKQTKNEDYDCSDCNDFIVLLRILLNSMSQRNNNAVIYNVKYSLFSEISTLILHFFSIITRKERLWVHLVTVFDLVFEFIYQFNRSMANYKFTEVNGKEERGCIMLRSPLLFSKEIIKMYLREVLGKINKSGARDLLCYLFRKVVQYSDNRDRDKDKEKGKGLFECVNTLNPVEYCIKEFNIPSIYMSLTSNQIESSTSRTSSSSSPLSSCKFSTIMINSHLIQKCLLSVILASEDSSTATDNKLHLLTYLDLLCRINEQNCAILLRGGIVKKLFKHLGHNQHYPSIDEKIMALLTNLALYFNKDDLVTYIKQIYVLLISSPNTSNIDLAKQLLRVIETNIAPSMQYTYSVTLSPINTHHTGTYYMLFLENQRSKSTISSNTIFVYYTLFIPSIESLHYFTLAQFVTYDNSINIYFDKESLHFTFNNNKKISLNNFIKDKMSHSISNNKWYAVLIQQGNEFSAYIKNSIISITYPKNLLFEQVDEGNGNGTGNNNKLFDFAAGYVYLKEITKRNDRIAMIYNNNNNNAYVHISYIILSSDEIKEKALSKHISKYPITTKPKLTKIGTKSIIAEVFFDQFSLVNVQSLSSIMYKMSDPYDLDPTKTELLVKVKCNDGLKGYNDLYLFKNCNLLDYASMNAVFQLETLNKTFLLNNLFHFNSFIHISLNNHFISDFLLCLLQNMDKSTFLNAYENIIRIVLVVNGEFQLKFFERHMTNLKILFAKYAADLSCNFVSLFIYNKYVDINEAVQYQIISELFFYPHLYTKLRHEVRRKLNTEFEKFINYYENNPEVDYAKLRAILVNLWSLFIHYEIDNNGSLPQGEESNLNSLSGCIELINSIIFNGKDSHNELAYLSGLAFLFQNTFSEYEILRLKNKKKPIQDHLPFLACDTIEKQISLMKILLKDFVGNNNSNQQKGVLTYLSHHFLLEFEVFMNMIRYEKLKRSLNKYVRLLYEGDTAMLAGLKEKYSWYLDKKEGNARMRRKMVIKDSKDIATKKKGNDKDKDKGDDNESEYINAMFKQLCLYDHHADLSLVKCMIDEEDKYQNCFICLLIERIYETASLIVLGDNALYLYVNVLCDKNKKIYPFSTVTTRAFWARNDIEDEWDKVVGRGKDKDKDKGKGDEDEEDPNILINHKNRCIKVKVIPYQEISELHKRRYMHQNNSMEIFLLNGSSYFITVFPKVRDDLFVRIVNNINDKSSHSKIANIGKASSTTAVYLKHYPFIFQRSKMNRKPEVLQGKTLIEIKNIITDVSDKWSQCFISNFNYIMILNTLSGRTYNDMSQYFIFPWILKDFFSPSFCLKDEAYFRDLTYPTHAQTLFLRNNLKTKITNSLLNHHTETCHSGVFPSNLTQISYYLLRLKPFTEVALEIHGGNFDSSDRLFSTMKIFCDMKNISQEWIPEIIYLPEMLINMNNYTFGREKENSKDIELGQDEDITYNDVTLPPWAKNDPRFFTQVMMKAVESPKVSENLHNWIDLLFGYKMAFGKINFEYFNRYLSLCYFFEDLKGRKYDKTKLNEMLFQTKEFGSNPLQVIMKNHIVKKEGSLYSFLPFFGTNSRIENCMLKLSKALCKIKSKRIGDMRGLYELPKNNITNGEGGLTALSSYIDQSLDEFNDEEGKLSRKYFVVGKDRSLMGHSFTSMLSYSNTSIYISKPFYYYSFEFNINEQSSITSAISTLNGKYIVIGLSNGSIIKYRKRTIHTEEVVIPYNLETKIVKTKHTTNHYSSRSSNSNYNSGYDGNDGTPKVINPNILFFNSNGSDDPYSDFTELDNNSIVKLPNSKKQQLVYYLCEVSRSNIPSSYITTLCLCESNSFLLAKDKQSNIYLYNLNNLKLKYKFNYNTISNMYYSIKYIKVLDNYCDFLIASKYSLHLYSINGLPLLDVDLFETHQYFGRSPITAIEAITLFDTLIFTGHADGSVYISKVITEVPYELPNSRVERPLYEAYHQRYNDLYDKGGNGNGNNKHKAHSQKRRLNLIKKIGTTHKKIIHLKISDDMSQLIIINKRKEVFCYNCDEYLKENLVKGKKCGIHKSTIKVQCKNCKKLICEVCLEKENSSSIGLCEECNLSNTSSDKLTNDY